MTSVDVTDLVEFHNNDDECLPITKCVCGAEFRPWMFIIGIYDDIPSICSICGRKLFFKLQIRVYEIQTEQTDVGAIIGENSL